MQLRFLHLLVLVLLGQLSVAQTQGIGPLDSLNNQVKEAATSHEKITLYKKWGSSFFERGKFKEAIAAYTSLIKLCTTLKKPGELPAAYNEIGNAYADLGDNQAAFSAYQKALQLSTESDASLQAKINKNLGAVFLSWKNLDQALHYYNIAQHLAEASDDQVTAADCLNNKGTVYEQQKEYGKALQVYTQALRLYQAQNLHPRIALTYNNLAILSKVTKDFKKAAAFYKKSVEHASQTSNVWLTAAISTNLGNLLSESGQTQESEVYLRKALHLSQTIQAQELIYETLENLALNASRQGDYRKAFQYHQQFAKAQHAFINLENTKEVNRLQTELTAKYEVEKKEKALAKSQAAVLRSQVELTRKNNLLLYALLGILLVGGLAVWIYRSAKTRQLKLAAENQFNLKLASAEARNQLQEEKLRISRELHDNIGSQLTFIHSSIQHLHGQEPDPVLLQETQKIAQNTISELRRTVWLINKQEIDLEEFVVKLRDYVKPLQACHPQTTIEVFSEVSISLTLTSQAATNLFRVIQEALNNALKYAQATSLQVKFSGGAQELQLAILDDGVGFHYFVDRPGGYGLKNIHARVEALHGTCTLHSEKGKGTSILVKVPI